MQHTDLKKRRVLRWLMVGLAAVVIAGATGAWYAVPYIVPVDTLFGWSKADMDAYAVKVMAPGSTALANPPDRLGYFNVLTVEALPHGFVFQHDSCNPFDWCGIAYSEQPLPAEERDSEGHVTQTFRPLGGNWYDVYRP